MRIFISHSSFDKRFVRTLKADLIENGFQTWTDEDELQLGDTLVDKLEQAINECSHFVIILSRHSVQSDWVKLELNKATLLKDQAILKKIIPIKYRECEIPEDLQGLLYEDLSREIVQIDDDRVKFVSDGYAGFLNKLIKTIKASEKVLSDSDRSKLLKEIKAIEKDDEQLVAQIRSSDLKKLTSISILLKVIRFKNKSVVRAWSQFIKESAIAKSTKSRNVDEIYPIILPTTVKLIDGDFGLGEEIVVRYNGNSVTGHFGGYRKKLETYSITIPGTIRRLTGITDQSVYLFEFDVQNRTISVRDL